MRHRLWVFTLLAAVLLISAFASAQAPLVISEFRVRGPNGANDEFIEIHNASDSDHTVAPSDGSIGYSIVASDGIARCIIPTGTVLSARGFYLCVNSVGYSLASYPSGNGTTATGDATYTTDIPDNAGIALFYTAIPANFDLAHRLDAVGSTSEANTLYKEGSGYPALTPFSINYSFVRKWSGTALPSAPVADFNACTAPETASVILDTNNNAADFKFVDTNGTSAGAGQLLGAPGPQNLSSPPSSLVAALSITPIDDTVGAGISPNLVRDLTSNPANNSTFGTISFRRRITNNTGGNVTRIRFRLLEHTTFPAPSSFADLRGRTSATVVVTTGSGNVTVQPLTVEQPPSQPNGTGHNSSVSAGTITLGTPLASGASVDVDFLFGIQQTGRYRITVLAEALPQGNGIWQVIGTTDGADSGYPFKDCNAGVSTSTTLAASAASVTYGTDVTLTATVTSSQVATGSVEFFQDGVSIGSASLDGSGVATKVVSGLNVASYNFTATYAGVVGQFLISNSGTESVTITAAGPVVTYNCPSATYDGAAHGCTASFTAVGGGAVSGTTDITYSGSATVPTNAGTYPVHIVFTSSDPNYISDTIDTTLTINPFTPVLTLTCTGVTYNGSPHACTASVTGTMPGTTSITYDGSVTAPANAGTYAVSASFTPADTSNYNSASGTGSLTIAPIPTTASVVAPTVTYPAAGGPITVTISASIGTPSGTVNVSLDAAGPAPLTLNAAGVAELTYTGPYLTAGNHTVTATYAAQGNYAASTVTVPFTVNPGASATVLTSSLNPALPGNSITFTATITGAGLTPTGNVAFRDGSTTLATVALDGSGVATFTTSALTVGNHTITAVYAGSSRYATSTSNTISQAVGHPQVTITGGSSSLSVIAGQSGSVNLSVGANGPLTGPVTFVCSGLPAGATCAFSPASVGPTVPATTSVTIATTGFRIVGENRRSSIGIVFAILLPGMLLLPAAFKRRRRLAIVLGLIAIAVLMIGLVGCGGNANHPQGITNGANSTPAGSYVVTVTGSSTGADSGTVTINLRVTQ